MCTIVALNQVRADYPVVLATNRDEFYARASQGPARILEQPATVGGRDLVAQGTWMGVTQQGLFVGVTNQRTLRPRDPAKRSRGEVVMQALQLGNARAIHRYVSNLRGPDYNAFNLMWGDADGLSVAYAREDQERLQIEPVPPGVHVLPNDTLDHPAFFKVSRAQALAADLSRTDAETMIARLQSLLADDTMAPLSSLPEPEAEALFDKTLLQKLSALCVRTPAYGTRSSTIVALAPGRVAHYLYADGPPDRAPFVDVTPLYTAKDRPLDG